MEWTREQKLKPFTCEVCGRESVAARAHKRACSPRCRKALSRWVKQLEQQQAEAKRKKRVAAGKKRARNKKATKV
jgi:serine protease inhibitor ecotin